VDHLAQDRDWWQSLVNAVMNLRVLVPQSWLNDEVNVDSSPQFDRHLMASTRCLPDDTRKRCGL
jgi:hypothetical protein